VRYCKDSGALLSERCGLDPRGDRGEIGYFKKGTEPSEYCHCHTLIDYCDGGGVAREDCPREACHKVALIRVFRYFPRQIRVLDAPYSYYGECFVKEPNLNNNAPYYADIEKCFTVSPANFIPPPKVTSSVIRMNIYKTPPVDCEDEENLFRVIRGAFAKRRKTLSNSLAGETSKHTKAEIEAVLVSLGYRADVRGETLGLADFARISDALTL
jgi:hypothetical protein